MKCFDEFLEDFYNGRLGTGDFTTENESGSTVVVIITENYLRTITYQQNGWARVNVYHKDRTVEECYEK